MSATPELLAVCRAIVALAEGQGRLNLMEVAGQARAALANIPICPACDGPAGPDGPPMCQRCRADAQEVAERLKGVMP